MRHSWIAAALCSALMASCGSDDSKQSSNGSGGAAGSGGNPSAGGSGGVGGSGAASGGGGTAGAGGSTSGGMGGDVGGAGGTGATGGASGSGGVGGTGAVGGSSGTGGGGTQIGPAGGQATGPDGASVTVPAGAVSSPIDVSITVAQSGFPTLPLQAQAIGSVYAFLPHNTTFAVPVTVVVPFTPGSPTTNATVLTAEPGGTWALVENAPVVEGSTFKVQVTHFSYLVSMFFHACPGQYASENTLSYSTPQKMPACACYAPNAYFGACHTTTQPTGCCPGVTNDSSGTAVPTAPTPRCAFSSGSTPFWGCCSAFKPNSGWGCGPGYSKLSINGSSGNSLICAKTGGGVVSGATPASDACGIPTCLIPPCS